MTVQVRIKCCTPGFSMSPGVSLLGGRGVSRKKGRWFHFFKDIELCVQSLKEHSILHTGLQMQTMFGFIFRETRCSDFQWRKKYVHGVRSYISLKIEVKKKIRTWGEVLYFPENRSSDIFFCRECSDFGVGGWVIRIRNSVRIIGRSLMEENCVYALDIVHSGRYLGLACRVQQNKTMARGGIQSKISECLRSVFRGHSQSIA